MDCHCYLVENKECKMFRDLIRSAIWFDNNKDKVLFKGYYPRLKETSKRGVLALKEISKEIDINIDVDDLRKMLSILRDEYQVTPDFISTKDDDKMKKLFSDNDSVYIGDKPFNRPIEKIEVNDIDMVKDFIKDIDLDNNEMLQLIKFLAELVQARLKIEHQ